MINPFVDMIRLSPLRYVCCTASFNMAIKQSTFCHRNRFLVDESLSLLFLPSICTSLNKLCIQPFLSCNARHLDDSVHLQQNTWQDFCFKIRWLNTVTRVTTRRCKGYCWQGIWSFPPKYLFPSLISFSHIFVNLSYLNAFQD